MALILTPSLRQAHFCKSDNCGISKVTRDSDLICQILTLTLSLMKILFTLIEFRNLYRVFKSFLISTAATVHLQELQECLKFHNDVHLFHGYGRFNTFWKINTVFPLFLVVVRLPLGIFVEVIVY
jgi:hypothetical protein